MPPTTPPRLHVLLARDAPVGVVIRRGPSRQSRLILWDTSDDHFTPGQWLKARVYGRRCDLSPDGTLLVYFALAGNWDAPSGGSYTAVSRPPYFTALALWPKGDAWHGGGLFADNRHLWLNGAHGEPVVEPRFKPRRLKVSHRCPYPHEGGSECLGVQFPRLRRDGWLSADDPHAPADTAQTWEKRTGGLRPLRLIKHVTAAIHRRTPGVGVYHDEHEVDLSPEGPRVSIPRAEWADFDNRGRLVYTADGKLWMAEPADGALRPRELADFNGMSFEPIPPPQWATEA